MQLNSKKYKSDHDEMLEREFQAMLDDARAAYVIPKSSFDTYRVKRGLREHDGSGVVAGVTRVGNAHGYVMNEGEKCAVEGSLEYRGYKITSLVNNFVKEDRYGCYFIFLLAQL